MTSYLVTLTARATSIGRVSQIRWYEGVSKQISRALFRAVSRAINNFITKNQED